MACRRTGLEESVLEEIRPDSEERARASRIAEFVVSRLNQVFSEATVTVEGSFAKDTWLRGDLDIDVFVLFPRHVCLSKLSDRGLLDKIRAAFHGYPVEERYAQHPYLRVLVENVWVDIVPGCLIQWGEKPLTAVDRTPLHRQYIAKRLTSEQRDEVRLLKKFMKTIGVYGAEIAVQGFSGYLVELLVAEYGCFRDVLEAASAWKPPVVIDPEGYWRGRERELLQRFHGQPLIVVDPVDPDRNVAAAVSLRSMAVFSLAARQYLANPSRRFFEERGSARPPLFKGLRGGVVIHVKPGKREPPDKLWGVSRRIASNASRLLSTRGFSLIGYTVMVDEEGAAAVIVVETVEKQLPELEVVRGPPFWLESHTARFIERHRGEGEVWVGDDGRLYALRRRRLRRPSEVLEADRQWVPGSARGYSIEVEELGEAVEEVEPLLQRTPHWLEEV